MNNMVNRNGRVKGARDRVKRVRKRFYKGKPIKKKMKRNGKFFPYVSKRLKTDPLKCQIFLMNPMSIDGYNNWTPKARSKIRKIVYPPYMRIDVDPIHLSSKEAIADLFLNQITGGLPPNTYDLRLFCHAKNRFGCSPKSVARIRIVETGEENMAIVNINSRRLSHYWFWRNANRFK